MRLHHSIARRLSMLVATGALMVLAACSTIDRGTPPSLERHASWVVLPFANHTETPMAGNRAEAIAHALLQAQGVGTVRRTPASTQKEALFGAADSTRMDDALTWAREQKIRYALAGSVDEWRYKVGVDGEPAVGLVLQVIDLGSGSVVWTATGARSGWSREALSAVGQKLMRDLLGDLSLR